ncbi:hypothetical protein DN062_13635 [Nitrincola tibetensis]|uniref:Uncharacterized protein n=1 Tax=Nitrincola tibetensis TaxID=2219697 RepID=A0A364NJA0_9GAMM|nr:hypothetical protein DN062_13635 [Nitrincola tibetensis]
MFIQHTTLLNYLTLLQLLLRSPESRSSEMASATEYAFKYAVATFTQKYWKCLLLIVLILQLENQLWLATLVKLDTRRKKHYRVIKFLQYESIL